MNTYSILQKLKTEQLLIESPFILSCLPKAEAFFREHSEKILSNYTWDFKIAKGEKYRNIMDMLLCNLFPYYKGNCKLFYLNRIGPLATRFSRGQLAEVDRQLLHCMIGMVKIYIHPTKPS